MGRTPAISVIVPVYRVEQYIRRCVDSLLSQTFRDFEVLLVDDGSPDGSGKICDSYAASDSRVRVLHKENGGVSSARQYGIDHAVGEYTIHADPDDWTAPELLETLYREAVRTEADIVSCDYVEEFPGRSVLRRQPVPASPRECVRMLLQETLVSTCWLRLVRRRLYTDWGITFPDGMGMWEDMAVVPRLYARAIRVGYVPSALYHYVRNVNPHAVSGDTSFESILKRERAVEILHDSFGDDPELSGSLLYLKLKVRTALILASGGQALLSEALKHYPESDVVIWRHPHLSFYGALCVWLCRLRMVPVAGVLLRARGTFKSMKRKK